MNVGVRIAARVGRPPLSRAGALLLFLATPVRAEDWTTTDGKHYDGITVVKVEADAVTIIDGDGGALVPLSKMTPELQKRFGYDPLKAQKAADARATVDAQNEQQLKKEAVATGAKRKKDEAADKKEKAAAAASNLPPTDPNYFANLGHVDKSDDKSQRHYNTQDAPSTNRGAGNAGLP
jgi:hypothetical protein